MAASSSMENQRKSLIRSLEQALKIAQETPIDDEGAETFYAGVGRLAAQATVEASILAGVLQENSRLMKEK